MALAAAVLVGLPLPHRAQAGPGRVRGENERVRDASGALLVLQDGTLHRLREREPDPLGNTDAEGTGRVHDLARDPGGLVFVAAERGLFVHGPWTDHLDRVELGQGAPPGRPLAVHVDEQRRVWLATERTVGVLDPSFYWGRTLAEDLLPGPGPYRLGPGGDGALRLRSGDGRSVRYEPDAGPPPRVLSATVDGAPWAAGRFVERSYGEPIRITAEGEGRGGAVLRYRLNGHHVWRHLGEELVLDELSPGSHTLDVAAVDRDLRFSKPFVLRLEIAYPFYYAKDFVLTVGALVSAITMGFFLLRARAARSLRSLGRSLVSTALLLVVAIQILGGLVPHGKGWPFVGYSMYSHRYGRNAVVYRPVLIGLRPNGAERVIPPQAVGVAADDPWQVLAPLIAGGAATSRGYVEAYRRRFPGREIVGLQVQARRVRLTDHGPTPVAPLILWHWQEGPAGG